VPGAPEIVVSTRWAPLDLPGRSILATEKSKAAEGWDLVRLPLYADADDDPLGRKLGAVLVKKFEKNVSFLDCRLSRG